MTAGVLTFHEPAIDAATLARHAIRYAERVGGVAPPPVVRPRHPDGFVVSYPPPEEQPADVPERRMLGGLPLFEGLAQ